MAVLLASHTIDPLNIVTARQGSLASLRDLHGGNVMGMVADAAVGAHWSRPELPDHLRVYFGILLNAARVSGKTVTTPCCGNCDGQAHHLEIRFSLLYSGEVCVEHLLLSSRPDPAVYAPISEQAAKHHCALRRCAVCGSLRQHADWERPADLMERLAMPAGANMNVVYRVCWNCSNYMRLQLLDNLASAQATASTSRSAGVAGVALPTVGLPREVPFSSSV